jgi:protein ImuB
MRRILSVWLPSWPTLRLRRLNAAAPDKPLATVETVRGLRRLAAVCPLAGAIGLRPEQALAEARAICPQLEVVEADPEADHAALDALAAWCERYTPLAAADPPDGLFLDITGCAHLFGGEDFLAVDLAGRLGRNALPCTVAVAGTAGAAWALARSATARADVTVLPAGEERAALEHLPIALLRLDARTVAGLRRLGLRSIGELARLPRAELAARFGSEPVLRLAQAFGTESEAITWRRPPAPWEERIAFAEPIGTPEDLARALRLLADRLCVRLEVKSLGGHRFAATFHRVDDRHPRIEVATALPVRDPAYLAKLLGAKLETVDPGFGIEVMVLAAEETAPLRLPQGNLSDLATPPATELAAVVDELANRLGGDRLWRPAPQASHVPERSTRRTPPLSRPAAWTHDPAAELERPVRLLRRPEPIEATAPVPDDPPIQFRWRGALHRVRAATGPERIAAEWWRRQEQAEREEIDLVRDYYRVEDTAGGRFWIFRTGLNAGDVSARWFVHGLFG